MSLFNFFKKREMAEEQFSEIHTILDSSFSRVKTDMEKVGKWIEHLDDHKDHHNKRLNELDHRLKILESKLIEQNHTSVEDNHSKLERVQSFNRSVQPIMNVQKIDELTPAQKQVVGLLVYSEEPLSYNDISNKLKINIVTVRRHINDIKRAGFEIKERVSVKSRRKVFFVKDSVRNSILKTSES